MQVLSSILDLNPAARRSGGAGAEAGAEIEIETEIETGTDGDDIALVLDLALMRGTEGSVGAAGTLAASPGVPHGETETKTKKKAQTGGRTNMWTGPHRRSRLWGISTMAKSPVSCSLAALCSWKVSGMFEIQ